MGNIKILWNRTEGHGMKLIKFHKLLHIVDDILKFGSHLNFNGGPAEATHKSHKNLTKLTQQRANSTFITQSAQRESDNYIIHRGMTEINNFEKSNYVTVCDIADCNVGNDDKDQKLQGSQYIIRRDSNNSTMIMEWKKKITNKSISLKYFVKY